DARTGRCRAAAFTTNNYPTKTAPLYAVSVYASASKTSVRTGSPFRAMMRAMKAGIWIRVSTDGQEAENQLPEVLHFAAHHGYEVAEQYEVSESAWNGGKDGGEDQRTLKRALDAAGAGKFWVLRVWPVARFPREEAEGVLRLNRQFRERGCKVLSVKEGWLNTSPEVQDVLIAFAGWMAQQESR